MSKEPFSHPGLTGNPRVIVGIGASAGGVEALGRFFQAMPADSDAAFVVVLHLDPTRESQMATVLSSHTAMPVVQVADGMKIEAGRVYVIAPDNDLRVSGNTLHLSQPAEPRGQRHPVDVLFRSLAEDQGERAIAIVLSGTGSNGTDGLKQVKAAGGCILIQDPASAKFDGMPRSAIAAGMADHILAPEAMPGALVSYLRQNYMAVPTGNKTPSPGVQNDSEQILNLLRSRGNDFGGYKPGTVQRRMQRRLGLRNIATLPEYLNELRANPDEMALLVKDLLINVTGFFRDAEAWKVLGELVITPMLAARDAGSSIRIWVPGCSTGEEAYSLAMLIHEQAAAAGKQFDISIFATDAREDNLLTARDGVYPAAALTSLEPARQRRFFDKLDGTFQVKKELRNMVVFAPHNLLRDPPFSRLDLVSCRNLLIYLDIEAQQRIVALCHFALREGGYLVLGNTETVGAHHVLFETVSKKWRIYRRLGPTRHDIVSFPVPGRGAWAGQPVTGMEPQSAATKVPAAEMAKRVLLERFAPASVLIDRGCRVLYFHGPTGEFLEQPGGEPTRNLFEMAREGLAAKLRASVRRAMSENCNVTVSARVRRDRANHDVRLTVTPLPEEPHGGGLVLVSFEAAQTTAVSPAPQIKEPETAEHDLQNELNAARIELQSTVGNLEATNEELKASNEEITSMNEELQSTNEELETSKEELQSFNEELHTVNNQLQHKVRELEDTTNDLNNLLAGTQTATLFLDTGLRIKWYAPATTALFDLQSSDIGRPIDHFARKFTDENLLADAEKVLRNLAVVEAEVQGAGGRWYLRRMLPYRTQDNRIDGVVVTFIEVTERKHAADAIDEARIYAEAIVSTVRQPLLVLDHTLRVVSANPAFLALIEISATETHGQHVYELGNGQWDIPGLRALLDGVLLKDRQFNDVEVEHEFRDFGRRSMLFNGRKLARAGGREDLILLAIEDITDRKAAVSALRKSDARLLELIEILPGAIYTTDAGGHIVFYNRAAVELWGREPKLGEEQWCGSASMFWPDGTPLPLDQCPMALALKQNTPINGAEAVVERPNGVRVPVLVYPTPLRDADGNVIGGINMLVDITESKRAEALSRQLGAIVEYSDDAIMSIDPEGTVNSWNRGAERLFGYEAGDIVGKPISILTPEDRRGEIIDILERIKRGESVERLETFRYNKAGTPVWISLTVSPIKNAEGRILGASGIARDMTERRRADAHREILVGELNHRVKNTLATVNAIATQTLGGAASLEEARPAFQSRLMALARAHDLLTRGNFSGTDIESVAKATIEPHQGGDSRFHIEGPYVELSPATALSFSLAFHELCTNAAKYGALTTSGGHVDIVWQVTGEGDDRRLRLHWAESGGPPVMPPARKGFGSRLIEEALAMELGGDVRIEYEPTGVVCSVDAPLPLPPRPLEHLHVH